LGCGRVIAFGDVGSAIAKRSVGIACWGCWECDSEALRRNRFWGVGKCDSEALRRNRFWGVGDAIAVLGCGSAIAKRSVGIAFGEWGCDRVWRCWNAIAFGVWGCDSEALRRNRFWRCWNAIAFGMWGCDSEALRRNRFWGVGVRSGFWECDRFLGILGCDRYLGIWGCDRCFRGVGMRSLLGDVGSAIAILWMWVRWVRCDRITVGRNFV
jgi:hypothetical protein